MKNLNDLQQKFDELNGEFFVLLEELLELRKKNPQMKAQTAKIMENELIELCKMIKEVSKEHNDDLMQGISLLRIKMMC